MTYIYIYIYQFYATTNTTTTSSTSRTSTATTSHSFYTKHFSQTTKHFYTPAFDTLQPVFAQQALTQQPAFTRQYSLWRKQSSSYKPQLLPSPAFGHHIYTNQRLHTL